jgi:aryl-alcohol dehydrogenase-like predicted oxidoreductase
MYPVPPAKETQGRTDLYIGSWLKTGRVKREDVVIATKVRLIPEFWGKYDMCLHDTLLPKVRLHACMRAHVCFVSLCVCVCVCVWVCMQEHVCMCVCVCV